MRMPRLYSRLRRLFTHAGLALALLFAQVGLVNHIYTAHPLEPGASELSAKGKTEHGNQAGELCRVCLAYSVFGGSLPVHYDSQALPASALATAEPHAHGAPFQPFLSYASRAPPRLAA